MMSASGPMSFYSMELARIAVPVCGIALILAALIRSHYGSGVARRWLLTVVSLWLLVTLANRLLLFAPIRKQYIQAAAHDFASAHQTSVLLVLGAYGWIAEQLLLLGFGVLLFFAVRSNPRRDI